MTQTVETAAVFHGELHVKPGARERRCSKCKGVCDRPGQRECKQCHAATMRAFRSQRRVRLLVAEMFTFCEPLRPCTAWSNGAHRVVAGECRCGKQFVLGERLAVREAGKR